MDHRVHGPKEPQVLADSSRGKCWQKEAARLAPDVRAPIASTGLRNLRPTRLEASDKSHASGQACGRGVSDTSKCRGARPWPRRVGQVEVSQATIEAEACRTHRIISERRVATQKSRGARRVEYAAAGEGRPRVEASGRHVEPRLRRKPCASITPSTHAFTESSAPRARILCASSGTQSGQMRCGFLRISN